MQNRDPLAILQKSDLRKIAATLDLTEIADSNDLQAAASFLLMAPKSTKWQKMRNTLAVDLLRSVDGALLRLKDESTLPKKRLLDELAISISAGNLDRYDDMVAALENCRKALAKITAEYTAKPSRPLEVEETAVKVLPLVAAYRRIVGDQIGIVEWRDDIPGKNSDEEPALQYRQYAFAREFMKAVHSAARLYPELESEAGFETVQALQSKGVSALRNAIERAMELLDDAEHQHSGR